MIWSLKLVVVAVNPLIDACNAVSARSTYNLVVRELNVFTLPILYSFSFCGAFKINSFPFADFVI